MMIIFGIIGLIACQVRPKAGKILLIFIVISLFLGIDSVAPIIQWELLFIGAIISLVIDVASGEKVE